MNHDDLPALSVHSLPQRHDRTHATAVHQRHTPEVDGDSRRPCLEEPLEDRAEVANGEGIEGPLDPEAGVLPVALDIQESAARGLANSRLLPRDGSNGLRFHALNVRQCPWVRNVPK